MGMDDKPLGVILAGGAGRRIGGGKPFVLLAGQSLLAHVVARLAPQCRALAINANDRAGHDRHGLPVIADADGGGNGPLAGILAAIRWAAAQGASHVLTAPVDTPFLPVDLAERLAGAAAPVALAATHDGVHGTCGLWSVALADPLAMALVAGVRRVTDFAEAQGAVPVIFPAAGAFVNVNTPEDLADAEARLARG
ncbi:molybdenum cofactor guanylyltransferase MobA [Roseicyclus mahoneyensis]|uniref:Molybdenum cofactor guanylyltransferase n=1 Tax=Roseicyclus mahoneyensis TaxID=164332 RepID=A0A316GJN5_9RHOB|nr:molybdenum cofactor guanylyltransferase MobA [Roseicyclus mahoneyensis]PWK60204.1 molybdenum cofactor guanylyltransferase [Roseicyclus mahoneyensis]